MKLILTLSIVLFTATSPLLAQQKLKRLPENMSLLGPVRTVRMERAAITNINGESVEGPRILVMTAAYNEDGTRLVRANFNENGSLANRMVETYEADGRLLESGFYNSGGTLTARLVNTYDTNRQLIEQVTFRGDGSMSTRTVKQRLGDQLQTEMTIYDLHGGVDRVITTNVTAVGERTKGEDLRERRLESTSYNAQGAVRTQGSITSNSDGSQEFKQERSDGTKRRSINVPNGRNGSDLITYNPDGSMLSRERRVNEFDSNGSLVKMTLSVAKGDSQTFVPTQVTYWTVTYYGKD